MKFKIGDIVKCKKGYKNNVSHTNSKNGGHGYVPELIGEIRNITSLKEERPVVWFKAISGHNGGGVFTDCIEFLQKSLYKIY